MTTDPEYTSEDAVCAECHDSGRVNGTPCPLCDVGLRETHLDYQRREHAEYHRPQTEQVKA